MSGIVQDIAGLFYLSFDLPKKGCSCIPDNLNQKEEGAMGKSIQKNKNPCIICWLSVLLYTAAAVVLLPAPGKAAYLCRFLASVSNQTELESAIATFNAKGDFCQNTITLTADIYLSSSTPAISNDGASLLIRGNGFSVDGQSIEGVRVFEIGAETVVTMEQITITGGNLPKSWRGDIANTGGGILNWGKLILKDSTVTDSEAYRGGGIANIGDGIFNRGELILTNSTISYNYASDRGGGIFNRDGSITLISSTISYNYSWGGGGICNYFGTLSLANCTISVNLATGDPGGGGIYSMNGILNLTNCTLSHNDAGIGAGIKNESGPLSLSNSIIANSFSSGDCWNDGGGTVVAYSSLIEETEGCEHDCIASGGTNGNIVGLDPKLGPLADNGGPTETRALLIGSPAINAGDNELAVDPDGEPLATDQRGQVRISRSHVDMGAYEKFLPIFRDKLPSWWP